MAFEIKKINPLDLQPRKAVGVTLPFSGRAVFNSTFTTQDAIKTNIINFFLTGKGERYLNPNFGSNLRNLLFDQITQNKLTQIKSQVIEELNIFFPRVSVTSTDLSSNENTVQFFMRYQIRQTGIEDELLINFTQ